MKRVIGRHTAFLKAFAKCASITVAAKSAGVDRTQHYAWLKDLEGYAEDWAAVVDQAAQTLEDEAVRRAHKGIFEPNTYQGEFVYPKKIVRVPTLTKTGKHQVKRGALQYTEKIIIGTKPLGVMKASDSLLMFLLKGLRPEKFRDRVSAEVTGKDGGPISLEQKRLTVLTDEQLTQLIDIAKRLTSVAPDGSGVTEARPE